MSLVTPFPFFLHASVPSSPALPLPYLPGPSSLSSTPPYPPFPPIFCPHLLTCLCSPSHFLSQSLIPPSRSSPSLLLPLSSYRFPLIVYLGWSYPCSLHETGAFLPREKELHVARLPTSRLWRFFVYLPRCQSTNGKSQTSASSSGGSFPSRLSAPMPRFLASSPY